MRLPSRLLKDLLLSIVLASRHEALSLEDTNVQTATAGIDTVIPLRGGFAKDRLNEHLTK